MTARQSLHTGSAAHAVLAAQDGRLDLAGLLALVGPTPLDVRQGILYAPGSPLNVTGDSSTSPWRYTVAAGSAVMSKGNADGPHLMTNDGAVQVSTTVPPGSNSRYDLIYIVQQDADATINPDGSTTPVIGVVNGTPGASPAVPALPAGAIALATALVASTATTGTSGAGVTIDNTVSRFTTTRGNPIPVRNATERAELTATDGLQVYRLDLHLIETYNGALATWFGQWLDQAAGSITITQGATLTKTVGYAAYSKIGTMVRWQGFVTITSTGTASNVIAVSMPVAMRAVAQIDTRAIGTGVVQHGGGYYRAVAAYNVTTGKIAFLYTGSSSGNYLGVLDLTAALVNGDTISWDVCYESAA